MRYSVSIQTCTDKFMVGSNFFLIDAGVVKHLGGTNWKQVM